jgi:dienelactone hydrolase
VIIYVHSTFADLSGNQEGQVITQLAAAQGFVALAPTYDSTTARTARGEDEHATCMFGPGNSVINYACSLAEADCSTDVMVAGFSQGGGIAMRAKRYDSKWLRPGGSGSTSRAVLSCSPHQPARGRCQTTSFGLTSVNWT